MYLPLAYLPRKSMRTSKPNPLTYTESPVKEAVSAKQVPMTAEQYIGHHNLPVCTLPDSCTRCHWQPSTRSDATYASPTITVNTTEVVSSSGASKTAGRNGRLDGGTPHIRAFAHLEMRKGHRGSHRLDCNIRHSLLTYDGEGVL